MEENVNNVSSGGSKKKIIPIAILVLVVLAVGAYFVFGKNQAINPANNNAAIAATVNGTIISKATLDTQLASSVAAYKAQGVDVTDAAKLAQIKTQVLDSLIGDELVNQGIAAAGIKVTAEEIEKQFQAVLTQTGGADKLQAELVKNNLTEAQLRDNISKQLTIQKYLAQNIDLTSVTASDAEIAQFYADYSKAQKAADAKAVVPALKDLSAQIKQQIISNKQQTLITNFIASLRSKATVEVTP
jgi:hypothetical protein